MAIPGAEKFLPYANLDEGIIRVANNKGLYAKLLGKIMEDKNYSLLTEDMAADDIPNALAHVHAIKGVSANLSLTDLNEKCIALEADMKEGGANKAALFEALKTSYAETQNVLPQVISFLS